MIKTNIAFLSIDLYTKENNYERMIIVVDRIPWDQYFMAQSMLLSMRSTCPRLAVGATIVRDKRMISGGYNGSVSGDTHCIDEGCYVVDGHCMRTVHAEANAIIQCSKFGASTEGAHIYVTHFPCLQCTKAIIQAGITKLYYLNDYHNHSYAEQLLEQTNVNVQKVHVPNQFFNQLNEMNNLQKHSGNLKES